MTDYQVCGAERQPLWIGNQAEQRPRCESRHGHDGPHRAGWLRWSLLDDPPGPDAHAAARAFTRQEAT